jgi:hypothetical protein
MSSKPVLRIDWATHQSVSHACKNWHYSGSVPVPPLVKIGVWENSFFIGVVVFSRGATQNLLKPYGLSQMQGCELSRIALTSHVSPVSRIIKLAIRFLVTKSPGMRLIVSFADPSQGHHGGVYQAGGWLYSGDSPGSREYIFKGKRLHGRQVSKTGAKIQCGEMRNTPKIADCHIVKTPGKHRYLMPLDEEMRKQIAPLSKPYPKRTKEQDAGPPPALGGVTPTRALHLDRAA